MLDKAKSIQDYIIRIRRELHQMPELGFDLPNTLKIVERELLQLGIESKRVGKAGISAVIGKKSGKCILLRADMDALPIKEESGYEYSSQNDNSHACGHDFHTSMLLGAAKLLKESEDQLQGQVKLMFQPAEEELAGAKDMLSAGILESPKVDAAFALHVMVGINEARIGHVYCKEGPLMLSGDAIQIKIQGQETHGSTPYLGVDAIQIAAQIAIEINGLIGRCMPSEENTVAIVGKIQGGDAVNIVAGKAEMEISMRTESYESRNRLISEIKNVAEGIANMHGGEAEVVHQYGIPPLVSHETLTREFRKYAIEMLGSDKVQYIKKFSGSEDFSAVAEQVPAAIFTVGLGSIEEGHQHYLHHASCGFDENGAYVGAALYAQIAKRWLEENC